MDVLDHMDQLLDSAISQGQKPQHWMIRQQDWLAIGERFRAGALPEPHLVTATAYREVPVHFSHLNEREIVGIVVEFADPIFAAR